jgi:hypothetical protein
MAGPGAAHWCDANDGPKFGNAHDGPSENSGWLSAAGTLGGDVGGEMSFTTPPSHAVSGRFASYGPPGLDITLPLGPESSFCADSSDDGVCWCCFFFFFEASYALDVALALCMSSVQGHERTVLART